MTGQTWSPEEIEDSIGARGLEPMVQVMMRKEGLSEPEARTKASALIIQYRRDPATGAFVLTPEEWRLEADELAAAVRREASNGR